MLVSMPFSLYLWKRESLKRRPAVGLYHLEHTPYRAGAHHPYELVVEDFLANFLDLCQGGVRRIYLLGIRVNKAAQVGARAYAPSHFTVSITFCALGKNSSKSSTAGAPTAMVTLSPPTSSRTVKRTLSFS
jgi:hypothetical protein